jgi:hypothetical protein
MIVTLGLLAPCLLAYATSRPGWRRLLAGRARRAWVGGRDHAVDAAELRPRPCGGVVHLPVTAGRRWAWDLLLAGRVWLQARLAGALGLVA